MEYLPGTIIAVCSNTEDENAAFREAQGDNRPLITVRERRKYARITCDMVTSGRVLTDDAVNKIESIQRQFLNRAVENPNNKTSDFRIISMNDTIIAIPDLLIPNAKAFARKIEPIVTDEENQTVEDPITSLNIQG